MTAAEQKPNEQRIVITGIGLTSPLGDDLVTLRQNMLAGKSGVSPYNIRYVGNTLAGICEFDTSKHQTRKELRRGTRAGSIATYCCNESVINSGLDWENIDKSRVTLGTIEVKALYQELLYQCFEPKDIIKSDTYDQIERMVASVMAHPFASQVIGSAQDGGGIEESLFWQDEELSLIHI